MTTPPLWRRGQWTGGTWIYVRHRRNCHSQKYHPSGTCQASCGPGSSFSWHGEASHNASVAPADPNQRRPSTAEGGRQANEPFVPQVSAFWRAATATKGACVPAGAGGSLSSRTPSFEGWILSMVRIPQWSVRSTFVGPSKLHFRGECHLMH